MRKAIFLAAAGICPVLFLGPVSAGGRGIYGLDDRKDIFAAEPRTRGLARSVAAVMKGEMPEENGRITLRLEDYKTAFSLCAEERFYDQPVGSFCTAALVAPDLVVTAGHCVSSPEDCQGSKFVFGFEMGEKGERPSTVPSSDVYSCSEILVSTSAGRRDFAVIRLDRPAPDRVPLGLNRLRMPAVGAGVFVIGTPLGLPLKVADGASVRALEEESFKTDLDTYGGNSGSPVFNSATGLMEGILIAGGQDLTVKDDICVISFAVGQDEGNGERVAAVSQFSSYIP